MSEHLADHGVAPGTAWALRRALAVTQSTGRIPSVVGGVVREGALVWADGYGDVPGPVRDTQYKIGSITKTITAVLVLQLVREGRFALEDRFSDLLPVADTGTATVRDLLAHRAGLPAEPDDAWWERIDGPGFAELVARQEAPHPHPVAERFHYSNYAYGLLGELVARQRDTSWWEAVSARVLAPLGMVRTDYQARPPHAQGFSVHPYRRTLLREPHPDTGAMAPAGQLWSTVDDLARYACFLIDGHPDVLDRSWLARAFTPTSGEPVAGLGYAHGLGFQMQPGGSGTLVGHTGSMPGFVATCYVDRARRTGAVAFGNAMTGLPAARLAGDLLETLEQHEPAIPAPWRPTRSVPAEFEEILGVWHWGPTPFVFAMDGEELSVARDGAVVYRFALREGRIVGTQGHHAGEELTVVRHDSGQVRHLDLRTFVFTRTPYDPAAPIPGGQPTD